MSAFSPHTMQNYTETYDHAVKVEEEHDKMESELEERFLLMDIQLAEDLCGIQKMCVVKDLLDIEGNERQVEKKCYPVSVDEEQECQEAMDSCFRDDIRVEPVAEIYGVDVVTKRSYVSMLFKVAVLFM
jgi:hypothetical protein